MATYSKTAAAKTAANENGKAASLVRETARSASPLTNSAQASRAQRVRAARAANGNAANQPATKASLSPNQASAFLSLYSKSLAHFIAGFEAYSESTRTDLAASGSALMQTVAELAAELVGWQTKVGNAEFDNFQATIKDSLGAHVVQRGVGVAAEGLFPGGGLVGAFLFSQTLGLKNVVAGYTAISDAKRLNRFVGGLVQGGIENIVTASGDAAAVLGQAARLFGRIEQMATAQMPAEKVDLDHLSRLPDFARGKPAASTLATASKEIAQAKALIDDYQATTSELTTTAIDANNLVREIRAAGRAALRRVQLLYAARKGFGKADSSKGAPRDKSRNRFLSVILDAHQASRVGTQVWSIALRLVGVDGFSSGAHAKSATKPTLRPLSRIDSALVDAVVPQSIGSLMSEGVSVRVRINAAGKEIRMDTNRPSLRAAGHVPYLSEGTLKRLEAALKSRSIADFQGGSLLFQLADPGTFEPETVDPETKGT